MKRGSLIFIKTDVKDLFDYMDCTILSNSNFKIIGKDDINKLGIYAKFECKEIILPPKKPKKPVKMVNFVDLPKGLKNGH